MIDERYVRRMVSIARRAVGRDDRDVTTDYEVDGEGSLWICQSYKNSRVEISYVSFFTLEGCFNHEVNINHDGDDVFLYDFDKHNLLIIDDHAWEKDVFSLERKLL